MAIFCVKLRETLPSLDEPPYPGDLGQKIFEHISEKAWDLWLDHQTILINEYRLDPLDPDHRERLQTEMETFLFEKDADSALPSQWQASETEKSDD